MRHIALTLLFSLIASTAWASGTRSADVSLTLAEDFPVLAADQLPMQLHYIGSTEDSHVFMIVKTAFGGGRPFDHLFKYRYPRQSLEIVNGWLLPEQVVHVRPRDCLRLPLSAQRKRLVLPEDRRLRERCLSQRIRRPALGEKSQ